MAFATNAPANIMMGIPTSHASATNVTASDEREFSLQVQPFVDEQRQYLLLLLLPLILCSITGNILVIMALIMVRKLQNNINYFLQSLAVADLMVALLVMPLGLVNDLIGYWPFGQVMCNIWATLDVLNCTASILHMCVMSVERYLAICHPLFYRKRRHPCFQQVSIKIALVWLISILLSSLLFILGQVHPKALYINYTCQVQHKYFQVYGSIFAFFIPLLIVIVTYSLTAIKLVQKTRACNANIGEGKFNRNMMNIGQIVSENGKLPEEDECEDHIYSEELKPRKQHMVLKSCKSASISNPENVSKHRNGYDSHKLNRTGSHVRPTGRRGSAPVLLMSTTDKSKRQQKHKYVYRNHDRSSFKLNNKRSVNQTNSLRSNQSASSISSNSISKENQANIVLGLVFASFVIGWAPFFSLNIYFALCISCSDPDPNMMQFFEWLGWASSLVNPFIYTIFNKTFRKTFWRFLQCYCCWGQRRRAKWNSSRGRVPVRVQNERSGTCTYV